MFTEESVVERRTKTRPISETGYVPPKHSADYKMKPLPLVPPQRSTAASINTQVNSMYITSTQSFDNMQPGRDWERDVDDVANMWENRMEASQSRYIPRINVNIIPSTPPDEILSPQPRKCVQKILRLAGELNPAASVSSSDLPSLHNSRQKIKQLTGFDVSAGDSDQSQLRSLQHLQDDVSPISLSSSMYSQEDLETAISEMDLESSDYNYRYSYIDDDDYNELATPLSPPNFGGFSTRPISAASISPTSTPAALCLSSYRGKRDTIIPSQVGPSPLADDEGCTSSTDSSPADHLVDLYHTTTSEIVRASATPPGPKSTAPAFSPSPAAGQRKAVWGDRSGELLPRTRFNASSSTYSLPSTSTDPLRKAESFSDRRFSGRGRGRAPPPPLEQAREAPRPGRYAPSQRTPYPLPSPNMKSAFDEDDGRKRFSLLSKVFGGGGGGGNSSSNRDSSKSKIMSMPSPREDRAPAAFSPAVPNYARKIAGPVTAWSRSPVPGAAAAPAASAPGRPAPAGLGVFQRTMENARQRVGLKTKADKRREGLKGKIRVVGPGELGGVVGTGFR